MPPAVAIVGARAVVVKGLGEARARCGPALPPSGGRWQTAGVDIVAIDPGGRLFVSSTAPCS